MMSCWNCEHTDLEKRFVPVAEAARKLGCSIRTLYRMMEEGRLDWLRTPGGRLRIDLRSAGPARPAGKAVLCVPERSNRL